LSSAVDESLRLWVRTLWDLARSLPGQLAREIGQDAHHALRRWRHEPLQALSVLAVLAIAVGVNTGVYSVLDALLLRSLPFAEPERLASLDRAPIPMANAAAFDEWRRHSAYLADAAVHSSLEVNLDTGREVGRARLTETSSTFFSVLGRQPIIGRGFEAGDETPGTEPRAVISHALWQQQFGGDPRVIGASVRLNGTPLTIVGVAPPGLDYPAKTHIWSSTLWDFRRVPKTGVIFRLTIGRLQSGLTWAQAQQAFDVEVRSRQKPGAARGGVPPALTPLQTSLAGPVRQASLVLMAGAALLLLLACANIANLMLARVLARESELKIRLSLGASRGRVIQQLLTETVLLAVLAGTSGLLVAWWITSLAALVQPPALASQAYAVLDWRVLGFTAAITLATGLIFGIVPAWSVTRRRLETPSRTTTASPRLRVISGCLVAAQVTIAIVLVTGSAGLGRTFVGLLRVEPGFDVRSLVSLNVSFAGAGYDAPAKTQAYLRDAYERIQRLPGVRSASATEFLPLASGGYMAGRFTVDNTGPETLATVVPVSPRYFQTMGTRVVAGREFTDADLTSDEPIAVVNEPLARLFGDLSSVIGHRLTDGRSTRVIVGVVQGMYDNGPIYAPEPQAFVVSRAPASVMLVASVDGNVRDALGPIRGAVASVDPKVAVFDAKTMAERLDETLARPKVYTTSVAFFGGLALLLAIVGVHGVVSHAVVQRTREMAIRLALGSTPSRLRGRLLSRTLGWVLLGALPGVVVSLVTGGYVRNLLRGANASLTAASASAFGATLVVAIAAIWWATRHVRALDVMAILRLEIGE
jgi:putative ABC transport system permease protein